MRSRLVPLKSLCVGERCTLNMSRAQTSSRWCVVAVRRVSAQMSSSSLDHGSKVRGPSPKALEQLKSATLIFTLRSPWLSIQRLRHIRNLGWLLGKLS
ncbi:hypothetical protein TNCV_3459512 [Trichonephila clavipes]|nr:hypothetical protein TNCV_3459512 [Trichonephila clavipes]